MTQPLYPTIYQYILPEEPPVSQDKVSVPANDLMNVCPACDKNVKLDPTGCSICRLRVAYLRDTREIVTSLPDTGPVPRELEMVIVVETGSAVRRFRPSPAAVNALLRQRSASWFLPDTVDEPTRLTLDMRFQQGDEPGTWLTDADLK